MKKYLLILLIFMLLFVSGCETTVETQESSIWERKEVSFSRIIRNNTPVRAGIGEKFEIVRNLEEGQEIDVVGEIGNWYVVRLDDNSLGSVNEDNATPIVRPDEEDNNDVEDGTIKENEEQDENVEPAENIGEEERNMVEMINETRIENGETALTVDPELTRVARIKSQDMEENNYFSHHSPTYGSPFDMLDHYNIGYLHAGENIAANPSIRDAHNSLMDSPGHRENILNPNYTHVGVGIVRSQEYGNLITQLFISKPR